MLPGFVVATTAMFTIGLPGSVQPDTPRRQGRARNNGPAASQGQRAPAANAARRRPTMFASARMLASATMATSRYPKKCLQLTTELIRGINRLC